MPQSKARTLSERTLTGLFFLQKYRFLTIAQFAKLAIFSTYHTAEVLRDLERWGAVGSFGYVGIPGKGKTPKVYFLKRKGWDILVSESDFSEESIGIFAETQKDASWTPQMYHRIHTIDLLVAAELALRPRPHLLMVKPFLSYRMIRKGAQVTRETTDFVSTDESAENRLVPDAAFILENIDTKLRVLFFVEMDMGTEQIARHKTRDNRSNLYQKFSQYDRYLQSMRYTHTYAPYGEFRFFTMLFVTMSEQRIENIRKELHDLPAQYAPYYRLTTYEKALGDFFAPIWKSRSVSDMQLYPLVR